MEFVDRVAAVAESVGHHPNIRLHEWCFVELEVYSHVSGGLTAKDVELAVAIDEMIERVPSGSPRPARRSREDVRDEAVHGAVGGEADVAARDGDRLDVWAHAGAPVDDGVTARVDRRGGDRESAARSLSNRGWSLIGPRTGSPWPRRIARTATRVSGLTAKGLPIGEPSVITWRTSAARRWASTTARMPPRLWPITVTGSQHVACAASSLRVSIATVASEAYWLMRSPDPNGR